MVQPTGEQTAGIEFELLCTYPWCVALGKAHLFARLKSIALEKVAAEPLVALRPQGLIRVSPHPRGHLRHRHRQAAHRGGSDSASSVITEVEAGRGVALMTTVLKLVAGKRLLYRALIGVTEMQSVGIARAGKGDVTPAGERFCVVDQRAITGQPTHLLFENRKKRSCAKKTEKLSRSHNTKVQFSLHQGAVSKPI